jgi:hypothetical protein
MALGFPEHWPRDFVSAQGELMKYTMATLSIALLLAAVSCDTTWKRDPDADIARDVPKQEAAVAEKGTEAPDETPASPSAPQEETALFPPEGVDHLSMTVTVQVDIFGLGEDTVELKGTGIVHRSGPRGPDGNKMEGDLVSASLRGNSKIFGNVVAMESPIQHSRCEYVCEGPGRYRGYFDINGWFWLPEHDLMIFSAKPVHVTGSATSIPPVRQKADVSTEEIALFDFRKSAANAIGVLTRATADIHDLVSVESYLKTAGTTVPALTKPR